MPNRAVAVPDFRQFAAELIQRSATWTQSAVFARECADGIAVHSPLGSRTFRQLHRNANRLAHALRQRGLRPGDAVALMCRNRAEFIEVLLAAMRSGLRLTPLSTHLTATEVSYILQNCGARVFFVETVLAAALGGALSAIDGCAAITIGTGEEGSNDYGNLLAGVVADELADPLAGSLMLYTSGTTGKPKGVYCDQPETVEPQYAGSYADYRPATDVALCCGPAYHAAPLLFDIRWPLASGVPIVLLEKWDSHGALAAIEQRRVTHAHMVPTMFQRLLALDPATRAGHDLSSLRVLVHGAAPCPIHVKRAMIEWLGPVLIEYYGATEGGQGISVGSAEWLTKPGTVGRIDPVLGHAVLDETGQPAAPGQVGRVFFRAPAVGRFRYFGDPQKTAEAYAGDRFTLGDLGYVDADGYLFLTGRAAECIISGGVNIYPQEVDDALLRHPGVADVCTVGVPDAEWGERVIAIVVPAAGVRSLPDLSAELMTHAAGQLAGFKRPRQILFESALPRSASGKLLRQQVRARFWSGLGREI